MVQRQNAQNVVLCRYRHGLRKAFGVADQTLVRQDRAFRITCCSGSVNDRAGIVFTDLIVQCWRRVLCCRLKVADLGDRMLTNRYRIIVRRQSGRQIQRLRYNEMFHTGVLDNEPHFLRRQLVIDRYDQRSQADDRHVGIDKRRRVPQQQPDIFTPANPGLIEIIAKPGHFPPQLSVSDGRLVMESNGGFFPKVNDLMQ